MALAAALATATACSGPSSPVPTGFPQDDDCRPGPRLGGTVGMGVGNDGILTDVDANVSMAARTDGGCISASVGDDD